MNRLFTSPEMKFLNLKVQLTYLTFISFFLLLITSASAQTVETFSTTGTANFTVPIGVSSITVECIGGGGGGGRRTTNGFSGGGGGGAYAKSDISVTAGQVYSYTVGNRGANTGTNGTNSSFGTSLVVAEGGKGAGSNIATGASGGLASNSTGDVTYNGGNGATGIASNGGGGGGAAGATGIGGNGSSSTAGLGTAPGGNGGTGRSGTQGNGTNAANPGGGGGGGLRTSGFTTRSGGVGGYGMVQITYTIVLCAEPTVQASAASTSALNTTSATLNWTSGNGTGGRIVLLKQGAAVNAAPTSGTSYSSSATFGSGDQIGTGNYVVYNGTGSTSGTISGLLPSTNYHYSIYEYNSAATCYVLTGTTGNFTTASCSPTVQPTLLKACPEYNKIYLDVTRGNGTNILIVARDGAAVNADPAYNATYTANATYGFGTQIGSGNYVVYNGSATGTASFIMTNVNPGVTYHFKAYEYNASPNCYNLVAPATFSSTARSAGAFISSTTTQVSTTVAQNSLSQQIVALQVVMGGGVDAAATINSITFNTAGSTNIANDIVQARIFYTGTNATFANATQYGETFTSFAGNLTATDNFALANGTNYFWVVYDLKISATISNVLDASIVNFNITDNAGTSTKTPSTTAPAGNRTIISNAPGGYCTPNARNGCAQGINITGVSFAGNTYPVPCGSVYYNQTAAMPATVTPGATYTLQANYNDDFLFAAISVWIDWNQNGSFENSPSPENVINESYSFSNTISVTVPLTAIPGATRMRVYVKNDEYNAPCGTSTALSTTVGHIIDYTVIVDGPAGVQAVSCTTPIPTVTTPVAYTQGDATSALTATGTALKWYTAATGGVGSATAPTPSSAAAGTNMYYVSQTTGGCEGPRTQIAVNVEATSCAVPAVWEGDVSSDWNTAGNWSTSAIPSSETDVTINPVTSPNVYPIISGANGVCNNFTINAVAPLSIVASYSLVINGNVSTSVGTAIAGAGTVHMNGTAAQTLTGNINYPILRIDNAAGVSVASGTQIITLALELKNGEFATNNTVTLRSTSAATAYLNNFSATFTGTLSGDLTVQRYLAGGLGYRYFSSPFTLASGLNVTNLGPFVSGTNGVVFDPANTPPAAGFPTCWIYNENDANATESPIPEWGWVSATNASNPLTPMQGFALNLNGNATISLTGTPSNGVVTPIAISNTPSSDPTKDGSNLVGNPYPSPMSWNALRALPANSGQFTNVIKYWSNSGQYSGQYADYNGTIGNNTGPNPDLIPLGQSFMVRRTTPGVGSFNVANSARVANASGFFYDAEAIPNLLRLRISGGSGNDEMAVYFTGEASNNYDENHDAVKSLSGMPGIPNIYSMNNTMKLAINAMGDFVENMEIPLGMYIMTAGNYTVLATEYESFAPTSMLYLEDRSTGVFYNLRAQSSVSFTLPTGEISGRFFLRFQLPLEINANAETCLGADGTIVVNNPSGDTWNVSISNEAGVLVENSTITTNEFTSTPLAAGNYTVGVLSADNFAVNSEASIYPAPVLNAAFATSATEIAENEVVLFTCSAPNTFSTYTWMFGDGTTASGSTSVSHTYTSTGIYEAKLKVSFENCDEIYSQTITVQRDATGILDVKQGGITVFPNPAVDMITVKYDSQEDLEWISIYDASGRLIQTEYVSGMFSKKQITLPVRELSNGMYFMTLKSAQNAHTVRFNIQK